MQADTHTHTCTHPHTHTHTHMHTPTHAHTNSRAWGTSLVNKMSAYLASIPTRPREKQKTNVQRDRNNNHGICQGWEMLAKHSYTAFFFQLFPSPLFHFGWPTALIWLFWSKNECRGVSSDTWAFLLQSLLNSCDPVSWSTYDIGPLRHHRVDSLYWSHTVCPAGSQVLDDSGTGLPVWCWGQVRTLDKGGGEVQETNVRGSWSLNVSLMQSWLK